MLARSRRALIASDIKAMETAGKIRCCQSPYPIAGSHCRCTEKSITSRKASQKLGIETPRKAISRTI